MSTTPRFLSGSTNGRGIVVTSTTAASGTVIHTTVTGAGASTFDEVYVYAQSLVTDGSKTVTINAGGLTSGDRLRFQVPVRTNGPYLLVPGLRYNGGVVIRAYATAASKVAVHGYVNRTS